MEELHVKLLSPTQNSKMAVGELLVLNFKEYSLKPFDLITIEFFNNLSQNLISDKSVNKFPEIVSLGFWLRKSNIKQLIKENDSIFGSKTFILSPIGRVLHICPANVDTMFVYSLAVSLLLGNKNILRISSRMNAFQVLRIFEIINELIEKPEFELLGNYINIITYDHSNDINAFLSINVNARIIWGGDQTINNFKEYKTAPRTKDIVFADRVSMLCINSDSYLKLKDNELKKVIQLFFNDAYTFDQMGCSSPQTIYFVGNEESNTKSVDKFQTDLETYLPFRYEADLSSLASLKLNRMVDDVLEDIIINQSGNNYIKLLQLNNNVDETNLHGCGGGYFYYKKISNIDTIKTIEKSKVQTITYLGLSLTEQLQLKNLSFGEGIDRIVPLGEALNFHYIWDGYNLFDELSRKVRVS
jgi:hypothetical protein